VLCAEVRKLKIEPPGVRIPRGLVDKARYTAITGEQSSRKSLDKESDPAGFECEPNVTKPHQDSPSPTETRGSRSSKNRVVTLSGSKVANLAAVVANVVRNYDFSRAIEVVENLRRIGKGTR